MQMNSFAKSVIKLFITYKLKQKKKNQFYMLNVNFTGAWKMFR